MNKFFAIIIIMCSLSLPVFAIEVQEAETTLLNSNNQEVVTTGEVGELTPDTEDISTTVPETIPSPYKEPVSKKKLAMKFLIAMLCVAGTSLFLYITLSIYNKFRDTLSQNEVIVPEGEKPLDSPTDLTEAVKTFVEKTQWDN